ncbi:Hypothetical predicted protein [Octopus vulgaris]|uniref:SAM domain-containing protein n=1 Tax=Octopus vulgaris TaxID=6645 RepID=A0AA36FAG3_OCTVU|nr:Hypothetical predicted protein [Octopus vulgaris]
MNEENTGMDVVDNIVAQIDSTHITNDYEHMQQNRKPRSSSITSTSNQPEVRAWLQRNGFTSKTCNILWKYDAHELFSLTMNELEQMLGHEEGYKLQCHLDGHKHKASINIMKTC